MKQPRVIGALVAAVALFLTMLVVATASPAQAVGWSGQRCDTSAGNGWKVCLNLHTVPSGNGIKIDQVQQCTTRLVDGLKINGTKDNSVALTGSSGNFISAFSLLNTGGSSGGTCVLTNPFAANQSGAGACYGASGTVDLNNWPDDTWIIYGKVLGGPYDCG